MCRDLVQVRISFAEKQFMTCFEEKAEWKASCLSVEELLCLQLSGYSSRQMAKAQREMDKARRILDRQAKAGVITVPYYADDYPWHFNNLCNDALRPEQDIALNQYCQIINGTE